MQILHCALLFIGCLRDGSIIRICKTSPPGSIPPLIDRARCSEGNRNCLSSHVEKNNYPEAPLPAEGWVLCTLIFHALSSVHYFTKQLRGWVYLIFQPFHRRPRSTVPDAGAQLAIMQMYVLSFWGQGAISSFKNTLPMSNIYSLPQGHPIIIYLCWQKWTHFRIQ